MSPLYFKVLSDEMLRVKNDISKAIKSRDFLEKKIVVITQEKDEVVNDRLTLRQRIWQFEKQIEDFKKYMDEDKRALDGLVKEKDILNKTLQRQQALQKDTVKLIHIQEQTKKKLELDLDTFFIESGKQKKTINQLERERDRLAEEQIELTETIQDNMEDIRIKKVCIIFKHYSIYY